MAEDPLKLIIGAVVSILIIVALIPVFISLSNMFTKQQCEPYINQISQKDAEITSLRDQLNQTNDNLQICRNEYNRLITENITKKDIEEIKQISNIHNHK
jgi:uncharacterized membrane protein YhiD involved in acid resistance